MFHVQNTDDVLMEHVATTRDYENVTKQQPSVDVKASRSDVTVHDSCSQYETLTPAQNDAAVTGVYQQLENN